jgi:DNA-binding NarL/FixJ family response regulator
LTCRVPVSGDRAEQSADHPLITLTLRERQVAQAVAAGASNREVAAALSMAPKTVECHLAHIYTKLDVTSRVQLAVVMGGQATAPLDSPLSCLTPTEQVVVALVGTGMSNRAVAARLYLSPKTVECYLGRIYRKLRIRSRCQLPGILADPVLLPQAASWETTLAG